MCSSNGRWEPAGLSVSTSFSQQGQVCLKLPVGGIFPFPPCLPTPVFYRPSGFAVVRLSCKALKGSWAPCSGTVMRGGHGEPAEPRRVFWLPGAGATRWQCGTPAAGTPRLFPVAFLASSVFVSAKLMIAPTSPAREQNKIIS